MCEMKVAHPTAATPHSHARKQREVREPRSGLGLGAGVRVGVRVGPLDGRFGGEVNQRAEDEERGESVVHRARGVVLAAALLAEDEADDLVTHEGHAQEGVERDVDAERAEVGGRLDVDGGREEVALLPEDGAARHARRDSEGSDEAEARTQEARRRRSGSAGAACFAAQSGLAQSDSDLAPTRSCSEAMCRRAHPLGVASALSPNGPTFETKPELGGGKRRPRQRIFLGV
eukprot:scaffold30359_cov59-Phaeocystis_antarctica.AAC.4